MFDKSTNQFKKRSAALAIGYDYSRCYAGKLYCAERYPYDSTKQFGGGEDD